MYNNDIVIENFINFCDNMIIAEEGYREGNSIIDKSLNKLGLQLQKITQMHYEFKEKTSKGKFLKIPTEDFKYISKLLKNRYDYVGTNILKLNDEMTKYIEDITQDAITDISKNINVNSGQFTKLNVSTVYNEISNITQSIKNTMKHAEKVKKSNDPSDKEFVHYLANNIRYSNANIRLIKLFLKYPVIVEHR